MTPMPPVDPPATGEPIDPNEPLEAWIEQPEDATGKHKAHAAIYLAQDAPAPGAETPVAFVLTIQDGWHLNRNPPKPDFVIPTEVSLGPVPGLKLKSVNYPDGIDFSVEGFDEPLSVYEHEVVIRGVLAVAEDLAGREVDVRLVVTYQACNDMTCTRPLTIELPAKLRIAGKAEITRPINRRLFVTPAPAAETSLE